MDGEAIEMLILTLFSIACLCVDLYRSYRIKAVDDDEIPEHVQPPSSGDWPY